MYLGIFLMATKIADLRKEIKDLKEEIARRGTLIAKMQEGNDRLCRELARRDAAKIRGEQLAEAMMKRLGLI